MFERNAKMDAARAMEGGVPPRYPNEAGSVAGTLAGAIRKVPAMAEEVERLGDVEVGLNHLIRRLEDVLQRVMPEPPQTQPENRAMVVRGETAPPPTLIALRDRRERMCEQLDTLRAQLCRLESLV